MISNKIDEMKVQNLLNDGYSVKEAANKLNITDTRLMRIEDEETTF